MTRVRGEDRGPETMFSYVSAEQRVPKEHPLRAIRALVDDVFRGLYEEPGSIAEPRHRAELRSACRGAEGHAYTNSIKSSSWPVKMRSPLRFVVQ